MIGKLSKLPVLDLRPTGNRSGSRLRSQLLARPILGEHMLFLAATLFVVLFYGYHFGTFDQVIHIPTLKKFADSSFYPGDQFIDLRFQHYSFFWFLFIPFYHLGILEISMFVTHLAVTFATFWALWVLSDTLFHDRLTCIISIAALALPHMTFGGWTVFEFSLLNRTFVLPFLLEAVILYLRRRYLLAFALLGLLYNLHALSVNFVLAMFLLDCVLEWRKVGWRTIILSVVFFVAAALPVLIWKLSGPSGDWGVQPEWFSIIARGMLYNNIYLLGPFPHILLATAGGCGAVALFFIARRYTPASGYNTAITHFVYALLIILAVQFLTATWLPLAIIIELEIIRAGGFVLILAYLYFANHVAQFFRRRERIGFDEILLSGAFLFSIFAFVPAIVYALQRVIASPRWRHGVTLVAFLALSAFIVIFVLPLGIWYPGTYVYGRQTPWYDAQIWARDHSPKDAVFITPPYIWWFYESEWRVFSERSDVVSLSELLEVDLAPNYASTWEQRFNAVAPGALARMAGDVFENRLLAAQAYYSLSDQDVMRVACRYRASYIVAEKPHLRSFQAIYENEQFVIYALPAKCPVP